MIKTWQERCGAHPDHDGIVSEGMIQARMQEEIDELRNALEQAQEPIAWVSPSWLDPETRTWESESFAPRPINGWIPLYTAPRQWQGLTDAERGITAAETWGSVLIAPQSYQAFARAIEARLKEKNM